MTTPVGPDAAESRRRYDAMAARYDRSLAVLRPLQERVRRDAVNRLRPAPGSTVLDVGCGTGASLALLVERVGPSGVVVGVDHSEGMLAIARRRVTAAGWSNVRLICGPVQDAALPLADGALFLFTHDLLRTRAALANVVASVRRGGLVVAAGGRLPAAAPAPVRWLARLAMQRYVTTTDGLDHPWSLLAARLDKFDVEERVLRAIYIASGRT